MIIMVHKTEKSVEQLQKELDALKKQEVEIAEQKRLAVESKKLRGEISKETFKLKHPSIVSGVAGVEKGAKDYLTFVRKDFIPMVAKGASSVQREWKKSKEPMTDDQLRRALND